MTPEPAIECPYATANSDATPHGPEPAWDIDTPTADVRLVPLVPNLELPRPAAPRTRADVPPGYGVQEQCLPFTAASSLGLIIPSPITFGYCPAGDVPDGSRAFRVPVIVTSSRDYWVFYVHDDHRCRFFGNAYRLDGLGAARPVCEPGISFFGREDQQDLVKLHLPYIWRTAPGVDTLFTSPLNRPRRGLDVLTGLVETDWYANPVNMVLRLPPDPLHVRTGDEIAHAILLTRQQRRPELAVAASHSRATSGAHAAPRDWQAPHARDRSAYKVLARRQHGRLD